MWAYETTFYQIYPLGFCGAPRENAAPVAEDELAQAANAAPNPDAPIMKIAQWADYLKKTRYWRCAHQPAARVR